MANLGRVRLDSANFHHSQSNRYDDYIESDTLIPILVNKPSKNCALTDFFLGIYTPRQWLVLTVLMFCTMTSSFAVCLFPPFFPRIAEKKGETASVYGAIIGMNCLTSFVVTPFLGKYLNEIGIKFAFVSGTFSSGVCCVLSGSLEFIPAGWMFITEALLIRAVHATANALVIVSTFSTIALEFPNSVAKVFSFSRTFMNVAQFFGPIVGGALHEIGGFKMPFVVMGSIQIAMTMLALIFLPSRKKLDITVNNKPQSLHSVMAIPTIWLPFYVFIVSTMSGGFLSINLEPKVLRRFGMTPFYVGVMFGLKDGAQSIFSPFWGFMCDHSPKTKHYIIFNSVLCAGSFILLGPFPGLGIPSESIWIIFIALFINGAAVGGLQVAGVVDAYKSAIDAGLPDDPSTHGMVAGLWSSLSGAGRFVSRAGSGILVDFLGFQYTSTIVVALNLTVIITYTFYLTYTEWCAPEDEDLKYGNNNCECPRDVTMSPYEVLGEKERQFVLPNAPSLSDVASSKSLEVSFIHRDRTISRISQRFGYSYVSQSGDYFRSQTYDGLL